MIVEMSAGGMSQRDIEGALEKALGQCVVSKRAVRDLPERLPHEYEACRTRDIRGFAMASLCMDTVYEPLRRWGSKTGSSVSGAPVSLVVKGSEPCRPPRVRALRVASQ